MTFQVFYRCGHLGRVKDGQMPCCGECGERGIARTLHAPPPRFVGVATGPYVQTQALDPAVVRIGESALSLRGTEDV